MKKKLAFLVLSIIMAVPALAQPKILAHRGFCTKEGKVVIDENTVEAIKAAQLAGCWASEFDVHLTADDRLIVYHNTKINKVLHCQKSNFKDIRAFKLPFGGQIPAFEEVLAQLKKGRMLGVIEIKSHYNRARERKCVEETLRMVQQYGLEDQVYYVSFSLPALKDILELNPEAIVVYNSSNVHETMTPDMVKDLGFAGISYSLNVMFNHHDWLQRCKELGLSTYLWMVNDKYLMDIAIEEGYDIVTTDYFDLMNAAEAEILSQKQ